MADPIPPPDPPPAPSAFAILSAIVDAWDAGHARNMSALIDVARVHTGHQVAPGSELATMSCRFAGSGR